MAERFSEGGADAETVGNIPVRRDPSDAVIDGTQAGLPAGRLVVFRALSAGDFDAFVAETGGNLGDFVRAYQAVERSEDGTGVVGAYRVSVPGQGDTFLAAEIIDRPHTPGNIGMNEGVAEAGRRGEWSPSEGYQS